MGEKKAKRHADNPKKMAPKCKGKKKRRRQERLKEALGGGGGGRRKKTGSFRGVRLKKKKEGKGGVQLGENDVKKNPRGDKPEGRKRKKRK